MTTLNRCLASFCLLSLAAFLLPYLNSWGGFPASYLMVAAGYFAAVLLLQAGLLRWVGVRGLHDVVLIGLATFLLLANLFFFTFFVSSWSRYELLAYAGLYTAIFLVSACNEAGLRVAAIFFLLQGMLAGTGFLLLNVKNTPGAMPATYMIGIDSKPGNGGRSVYVVGIDAMVSREAKKILFDMADSEAYAWLASNGFALYDGYSPGDQTLSTYGALLSGNPHVHPRTVRRLFNGTQSGALYDLLKSSGYRRQFFFENDYFGVGPGYIEDFRPVEHSGWSFCKFTDDRWGFYLCRLLNRFVFHQDRGEKSFNERLDFYLNNVRLEPGSSWFSIGHIWYPGHTVGDYDAADEEKREAFVNYYRSADKNLIILFSRVVSRIRSKDPNAVIFFMGDHGAHMLRSESNFLLKNYTLAEMPALMEMDSRSVLWAVSPQDFCRSRLSALKDSSLLLIELANCAKHP
jgi:hypothetical protein